MVSDGQTASIHYTGTLDDGSVFDSSRDGDPLSFVVGSGQVISGFDDAVKALAVGGTSRFRLEPADAYGDHDPALVVDVPADDAPGGLSVDDIVRLEGGAMARVTAVSETGVTIDANHPMAGKPLTFEIEVVSAK